MKLLYKNIFIAIAAIVTFSSCRDEVILDLNTVGPVVVIESKISNDSVPFLVRVTTTADYYSLEIPVVTDAFVTIGGSDGTLDTLVYNVNSKHYQSNPNSPHFIRRCKVGLIYTLNVSYKGKTYTASEMCRPQSPIDSVKMIYSPKRPFFPEGYYLWEWAQEHPGIGDCYQWNLYRNDTLINDDFYFLNDDLYVDGDYLASDYPFRYKLGDSVEIEQFSITRQFYNYLTSVQSQTSRDGSPFSAPPSNLAGNISNGAMGYFAVRNLERRRLVVK